MKQASTLFLRGTITILGLIVLALCVIVLPAGIRDELTGDIDYLPIIVGMYVTAVPFFIAIYQAMKLLNYVDTNQAFSDLSVKALNVIKYCALIISAVYVVGLPYIITLAQRDDAPGLVLIGLIFVIASGAVAVIAAVLQYLLKNAVEIKSENDLTV